MLSTQQVALWADELRDLSALGLKYAESVYDRERYERLQNQAVDMMAAATGSASEELEPLKATVFSRPTPLTVGDAAIFNDDGQILLIQRSDNQKWAMPGGALEVGETPAEGVVREALEETGLVCEPISMVGVFDSRLCDTVDAHHLYHFVFLCRPTGGNLGQGSTPQEVLDVKWFDEDNLPDSLDPSHVKRIAVSFQVSHGKTEAFFD